MANSELLIGIVWWSGLDQWAQIWLDATNSGWPPDIPIWTAWYIRNTTTTSRTLATKLLIGTQTIQGSSKQVAAGEGFASEMPSFTLAPGTYDATVQITVNGIVDAEYPISIICGSFIYPTFLVEGEGEINPELGPYYAGQSLLIGAVASRGWQFVYWLRNGVKWIVGKTNHHGSHTFLNLQSGEVFVAVFEELAILGETRIVNFSIEPVKASYAAGETVMFAGKLQIRDPVWRDAEDGFLIKLYADSTEAETTTDSIGHFSFLVTLPYLAATYRFFARYPGRTFPKIPACNSSAIDVVVSGGTVDYVCPYCGLVFTTQELLNQHIQSVHGGGIEIPWDKIAIGAAIAAGIIVIATVVRR